MRLFLDVPETDLIQCLDPTTTLTGTSHIQSPAHDIIKRSAPLKLSEGNCIAVQSIVIRVWDVAGNHPLLLILVDATNSASRPQYRTISQPPFWEWFSHFEKGPLCGVFVAKNICSNLQCRYDIPQSLKLKSRDVDLLICHDLPIGTQLGLTC